MKLPITEGKDIRFAHLTARDGLSPGTIRDILQDDQGFLWFNTSGTMNRYDSYDFNPYRRDAAHPNYPGGEQLHYSFKDRSRVLWVGSNESLDRFDPATDTSTRYPVDRNGPQSLLGPIRHISQDEDCNTRHGQMFFGSKSGLTSFWPDQVVEKPSIPTVVLTGFSLRNEPVPPGPGPVLAQSITYTRSVTLSHKQNIFSFQFAALSYVDPRRNQYRYMLEPLDSSWHLVGADHRLATFTTLPAGSYTLRVQASNNREAWNEQGIALHCRSFLPGGRRGGSALFAQSCW